MATERGRSTSFTRRYERAVGQPLPDDRFAFGDSKALADELAALVATGRKTSTSALLADYEVSDEPLPAIGDRSVVLDGDAQPVCVIETRRVAVRRFSEVDAATALAEGEGDGSLAYWRAEHERAFRLRSGALGVAFDEHVEVVVEHFVVVHLG